MSAPTERGCGAEIDGGARGLKVSVPLLDGDSLSGSAAEDLVLLLVGDGPHEVEGLVFGLDVQCAAVQQQDQPVLWVGHLGDGMHGVLLSLA